MRPLHGWRTRNVAATHRLDALPPRAGVSPYRASSPSAPGLLSAGRAPIPAFHLLPDRWRGYPPTVPTQRGLRRLMWPSPHPCVKTVTMSYHWLVIAVNRLRAIPYTCIVRKASRYAVAQARDGGFPRPPAPSPSLVGYETVRTVQRWRGGEPNTSILIRILSSSSFPSPLHRRRDLSSSRSIGDGEGPGVRI
jgi:hypothetical protein